MTTWGRRLSEGKEPRLTFGISLSGLLCLLILFQLLLVGQAAADPVILNEDTGGSWRYSFVDDEGVETCDNVIIANDRASLLPILNGTSWDKKGVAVENGGTFDYFFAKTPYVIKDGGVYKMWYSGVTDMKSRILYATSIDGINWDKQTEPVLNPGRPGELDDSGVSLPRVIKDGGTYRMWYTGNDSVNEWAMYATSPDGLTWTKRNVVFEETGVRPNTVIKDGAIYKMWYQYLVGGHYKTHYAESTDGIEWTRLGIVLDVGDPGEQDGDHISGAAVVKDSDGTYRMWYAGHDIEDGYRIFYASSNDEYNWIRHGLAIDQGTSGEEDQGGASYPCVIKDDDGYYKIWYNGVFDAWDVKIMLAFNSPAFMESGCLRSVEIPLDQGQTWKVMSIDKRELGSDNFIQVSILDGATSEPIPGFDNLDGTDIDISSIDNSTYPTIRLYVSFTGDGTATPVLDELNITWQNTRSVQATTPPLLAVDNLWSGPAIVIAAAIGITLFSFGIAGSTEVGKYRLIPFISPLYSRLKREEVLDQFTRDRIYEYIMGNPGEHYNSIKKQLNLNNGALAYHLRTLERENFIKSKRDGIYKRFYPVGAKIPGINGFSLISIQGRIMEMLLHHPGLKQKDISKLLDASQQLVSYHVNQMIKQGMLRAERQGNVLRYYLDEEHF